MSLIIRAATLAEELHAGQTRKVSLVSIPREDGERIGLPFFSHLMEVAGMVQSMGGSEKAVAAAWLHDAIEDTHPEAKARERIMLECGSEVFLLVLECTEIGTGGPEKAPWKVRKDAYISHLAEVSAEALLISTADKLHSLRDLKRNVRVNGDAVYSNLVKSAPEEERKRWTLWFNSKVASAIEKRLEDFESEWFSMRDGVQALADEFEEVLFWLKNH